MPKKKKPVTDMATLTKGYEKFIKGKELNKDGKQLFAKALSGAVKQRAAK